MQLLPFATSNQLILAMTFLARYGQKPSHSLVHLAMGNIGNTHMHMMKIAHCALDGPQEMRETLPRKPVQIVDARESKPSGSSKPAPTKRLDVKTKPTIRLEVQELDQELEIASLDDAIVDEPSKTYQRPNLRTIPGETGY